MRIIKKVIEYSSRKEGVFKLVPFGDLHFGHPNCDVDLIERTRNYILETENCFWIGMGDYCDAISPKDKRFNFHSVNLKYATPDVQYRWVRSLFDPIKDKCIGLLDGNHDLLHWKAHAHNYVDSLAYDLGVPYLTIDAYIRLVFKRKTEDSSRSNSFNIYAHHGWTASRTSGGKVNRIEDLASIFPGLELYLMGHTHARGETPPKTHLFVNKNLDVVDHEMRFLFTGAFLRAYVDGHASYIEEKTYKPQPLGTSVVEIDVEPEGSSKPPKIKIYPLS